LATLTETITLDPPVFGLDIGLAVASGVALDAEEEVATGEAVSDGIIVGVSAWPAVEAGVADEPAIMEAVIEVISGAVLPATVTIIIADATAGTDKGVWSLLTNSADKTCKPGITLGQV